MRRAMIGAVVAVVGAMAAAGPVPGPAQAATVAVSTSVRISDRSLDLTDGGVVDRFRIAGSSSRRLELAGIVLSRHDPSGPGNAIGTVPNPIYPTNARWTTKLSGDRDSGDWRVSLPVRGWTPAGSYDLSVVWNVGWSGTRTVDTGKVVTIVNPHGDLRPPVLNSWITPHEGADLSLRSTPLVSFHVTDHGSGTGLVWICYLSKSDLSGAATCDEARLTSGIRWDGVYSAHLGNLPYSHLPTGPAAFWIQLNDYAGWPSSWAAADVAGPAFGSPIPGGQGDFDLVR